MKNTQKLLFLLLILLTSPILHAGTSAVVITYQPIITESESTPIETRKGFLITTIPFYLYHHYGKPPYAAIAHPHELPTDAPRNIRTPDANLISASGIRIAQSPDDNDVNISFEDFRPPANLDIDLDTVAEATLECIRRLAHENKDRPNLIISGKPGDEEKWQLWQKTFADHDLSQPFKQPTQ